MPYTKSPAEWNAPGAEPAQVKKDGGWSPTEKPPADWFNWFMNRTFLSIKELQENAANIDGSLPFSGQIKSNVAQGTAPLVVASKTVVANLNADQVDGMDAATAATASTVAARDASGDITTRRFISGVATGTAPLQVASATLVANLNVDLLDGFHAQAAHAVNTIPVRDGSGDLTARRFISNVATGTAPFGVTSTTVVANLNADQVDGFHLDQDTRKGASPTFEKLVLSQAAGTAPMTVTSDTLVANLNADMVDGQHAATGATANTLASRDGSGDLTARRLISSIATGTAPLQVTSNTLVANLNADTVDGYHLNQDVRNSASPTFAKVTAPTLESTVATGTAPFTVASQTLVANLNADLLEGYHATAASTGDTVALRSSAGVLGGTRIQASIATGTAPFIVTSTTMSPNLNADMVDGYHFNQDLRTSARPTFAGIDSNGGISSTGDITGRLGHNFGYFNIQSYDEATYGVGHLQMHYRPNTNTFVVEGRDGANAVTNPTFSLNGDISFGGMYGLKLGYGGRLQDQATRTFLWANNDTFYITTEAGATFVTFDNANDSPTWKGHKIYHNGLSGPGSGVHADLLDGWHIYNDITELGLTHGTETMEAICAAMKDKTMLIFRKVTGNLSTAYPASAGILTIKRLFNHRVELRFVSGNTSFVKEWVAYYDTNIAGFFSGWLSVTIEGSHFERTFVNAAVGTNTSIASGVSTKMPYSAEYSDHVGEYNPSTYRFTAKRPGMFLFIAQAYLLNAPSNIEVYLDVVKNGTGKKNLVYSRGSYYAASQTFGGSTVLYLDKDDYAEVFLQHNAGSSLTTNASATHNALYIIRVS